MFALLRKVLTAHPFEPFTVATSDGASLTVGHPEFAAVLRKAGMLYVELPEEEDPHFISLRMITDVRVKLPPHTLEDDDEQREEPPSFS